MPGANIRDFSDACLLLLNPRCRRFSQGVVVRISQARPRMAPVLEVRTEGPGHCQLPFPGVPPPVMANQ